MASVFIHVTMSLDGCIAGPNDEVDWSFDFGSDAMADKAMRDVGAVVMGNRGFNLDSASPDMLPYGGMLKVPHFVVTHEPRPPVSIGGLTFTFVDRLERALEEAGQAAGPKKISVLGASIDQQALRSGYVDELVIHLAPILLGEGLRLFEHLGGGRILLERLGVISTAQETSLRFRVQGRENEG